MTAADLALVTIVAERVLESRIAADIKASGASGYTVTDARGEGSRHVGSHTFEGRNVRFEVVAGHDVAHRILDLVADRYFPHYGVIAYLSDVTVVRGEKYLGPPA
jgi:nitrogen regulatory protein P-II 2